MEIKGDCAVLNKYEIEKSGYQSPVPISEYPKLKKAFNTDRDDLIDRQADDGLSATERAMLLPLHGQLEQRRIILQGLRAPFAALFDEEISQGFSDLLSATSR